LQLKKLIAEKKSSALIEIDGGVNQQNFRKLVETGADVLVAGMWSFLPRIRKESLLN